MLIVIPLKFCYGMFHGYTVPLLILLAIFQSANLALIGCCSRSFSPMAMQTFFTFWVALTTMWLTTMWRERRLSRELKAAGLGAGLSLAPEREAHVASPDADAGFSGLRGRSDYRNSREGRRSIQRNGGGPVARVIGEESPLLNGFGAPEDVAGETLDREPCCCGQPPTLLCHGPSCWADVDSVAVRTGTCTPWLGSNARWGGWSDGWLRLAIYGACSVLVCNFALMLLKLWLDEPSAFQHTVRLRVSASRALAELRRVEQGSGSGWAPEQPLPLDPDQGHDKVFSHEGNLRLVELLMGAPGLTLSEKLGDNGKVFAVAMFLTLFTVQQAKSAARYCAPNE